MSFTELQHKFFETLMESQYWSPQALQDYQRGQLSQLLRHARSRVPFYRERLDVLFRPGGEIDWDRWDEVPILKRADVADHGQELLATTLIPSHGRPSRSSTSGTSGKPITLTTTQLAYAALAGNMFRAYKWHNVDWTRDSCWVFGDDAATAAWPDGLVLGPWGPPWDMAAEAGRLVRINRLTPFDKVIEFIARTKPGYLTTGPEVGFVLAREAERLGVQIEIDAFLPHGARIDQADRDAVKRVFGARTVELYSSKEAGQIAHACPTGGGMHVNAETVLMEIVDEAGRPVPPWTPGRVILTPIFNSAQPLIRYDQGDTAAWMEPCTCGRHLPRIDGLIGRATALFYHPDGRVRPAFIGIQRPLLKCTGWQIAQTGPHTFEVRYVPIDPSVPGDETALAAKMRELYFEDAEISFRRVADLPVGAGGKAIEYVNEWRPPN